jgi:hypothetical protein
MGVSAAFVLMPKASVNKNNLVATAEYQICHDPKEWLLLLGWRLQHTFRNE